MTHRSFRDMIEEAAGRRTRPTDTTKEWPETVAGDHGGQYEEGDSFIGECHGCGHTVPIECVEDPYDAEVHGESNDRHLCYPCWYVRFMDA